MLPRGERQAELGQAKQGDDQRLEHQKGSPPRVGSGGKQDDQAGQDPGQVAQDDQPDAGRDGTPGRCSHEDGDGEQQVARVEEQVMRQSQKRRQRGGSKDEDNAHQRTGEGIEGEDFVDRHDRLQVDDGPI